jgi:acyl carrier protein
MSVISAEQIRTVILSRLQSSIAAAGLQPDQLRDDLDLLTEGLIDSMGIVDLVSALEKALGVTIDFAELDPE